LDIKNDATTLGDVGGSALSQSLEMRYLMGSIIFGVPLVAAVSAQFKAKVFNSSLYWNTLF